MRILFDQSVHDHRNQGNNALLEVARDRFRMFLPDAHFDAISISPYFCRVYLNDIHPVDPINFVEHKGRFDLFFKLIPKLIWRLIFEMRELVKVRGDTKLNSNEVSGILEETGSETSPKQQIIDAEVVNVTISEDEFVDLYPNVGQYDLYIPTGGGYLCDSDKRFIFPLFDRLEAAHAKGVLTAMVGQGIGPLDDPELRKRASEVLPKLDYLLVREETLTRPLLDALGVPSEKVLMTGDDAIELAYLARSKKLGVGIGLSLRVAAYTDFNRRHINAIRPAIFKAAEKYGAKLISAPIDANDADKDYIAELMKGYNQTSSNWWKFESTSSIINRIGQCRIMITGTFHGAVFAISQGIPVIGLANSVEYRNKLAGLATEFGSDGCRILDLKDDNLEDNLLKAIDLAWSSAEQLRPLLLEKAKRQIDMGHSAYQKIFSLVDAKKKSIIR